MATREQIVDAIIAEAIGEGYNGMVGVAWTMQNRALEKGKPITSVVTKGAYSGLANPGSGVTQAQQDPKVRARVERILNGVESGSIPDPTNGATHYWSPKGMKAMGKGDPYWAASEEGPAGRLVIGNHVYLPKRAASTATAPTPATMPEALRSRIPETALAAIEAASGTTNAAAPELAYAGMPPALSTAVQRVQETSVPPFMPRARPQTPAPDMISTSMAAANAARPVAVKPTQTRAADLAALSAKPTAFLKTDGSGVTDTADIALFGKTPAYREIGSLPQQAQPIAKTAPKMPTRLAQSYAAQEANKPAPKPANSAPTPVQQSSQTLGQRVAASVPETQAAANAAAQARKPVAKLPAIPASTIGLAPATRTVTSVPVAPAVKPTSASDLARGNARQTQQIITTVASIPTAPAAPKVSASDKARGKGKPAVVAQPAGSISTTKLADRLPASDFIPVDPGMGNVDYRLAMAAPTPKAPISRKPAVRTPAVTAVAQVQPSSPPAKVAPNPRARPMAVGTDLAVTPPMSRVPLVAPVPAMPFAPMNNLTRHPALNLLAAMVGRSDSQLGVMLGNDGPRAPVGAALGTAANGGQMIQGHNGVQNSITQKSDAWKKATGQSSYGSGQSNDTKYESYF